MENWTKLKVNTNNVHFCAVLLLELGKFWVATSMNYFSNQHMSALMSTTQFYFLHWTENSPWWTISTYCSLESVNLCVPFASGIEAWTAESIPGAVGVSGEAAVSTSWAVSVATVQGDLWDPELRADIQLLLQSKQFKCQLPCLS